MQIRNLSSLNDLGYEVGMDGLSEVGKNLIADRQQLTQLTAVTKYPPANILARTIIFHRDSLNVGQDWFPTTTRITSSEKTSCRSSASCVLCFLFLHSSANFLRAYRVVVRIFRKKKIELPDTENLSSASSILRPWNIEYSGFDPIFLLFCILRHFVHVYVRTTYCATPRSFGVILDKAHASSFTEFVSQESINGLRIHIFTKYVLRVIW